MTEALGRIPERGLDLKQATVTIPAALAKRRREHRIYLTELEASLLREQLMARTAGTSLVFPTVEGKKWTSSRFGDRVWVRSIEAAVKNDLSKRDGAPSIFEGFTFHLLRHTAASLMALAGMDAAAAAERLEHSDGGALSSTRRTATSTTVRSVRRRIGWKRSSSRPWTRKGH